MKSKKIEIGCRSYVTAEEAVSVIKNRFNGSGAWVSKLTTDTDKSVNEEIEFKRTWLKTALMRPTAEQADLRVVIKLTGPGVYEYGRFCGSEAQNDWERRSFFVVEENGDVELIERYTAAILVMEQEIEPPEKTEAKAKKAVNE